MKVLSAPETATALPWRELIAALDSGFKQGCEAPLRHHHNFDIPNEAAGTLLLMPAWASGEFLGIKQVLVIPENYRRQKAAVAASYQLYSAQSGELLALIDGAELTNRRTAAASALASTYLSKSESNHLLMIGAGGLAPYLIAAHKTARPIERVSIWARDYSKAQQLANKLGVTAVEDLNSAVSQADIISSATLSESPLVLGEHVRQGTHVDLVGAFTPTMRESDDALISSATLFADTYEGVISEGGDFVQPLSKGLIQKDNIVADLFSLSRGEHPGRSSKEEVTVFKSTGTALEDLVAGVLAFKNSLP